MQSSPEHILGADSFHVPRPSPKEWAQPTRFVQLLFPVNLHIIMARDTLVRGNATASLWTSVSIERWIKLLWTCHRAAPERHFQHLYVPLWWRCYRADIALLVAVNEHSIKNLSLFSNSKREHANRSWREEDQWREKDVKERRAVNWNLLIGGNEDFWLQKNPEIYILWRKVITIPLANEVFL